VAAADRRTAGRHHGDGNSGCTGNAEKLILWGCWLSRKSQTGNVKPERSGLKNQDCGENESSNFRKSSSAAATVFEGPVILKNTSPSGAWMIAPRSLKFSFFPWEVIIGPLGARYVPAILTNVTAIPLIVFSDCSGLGSLSNCDAQRFTFVAT